MVFLVERFTGIRMVATAEGRSSYSHWSRTENSTRNMVHIAQVGLLLLVVT